MVRTGLASDHFHDPVIRFALAHDQHVLTVKPLVLKYGQAVVIEKLAHERGKSGLPLMATPATLRVVDVPEPDSCANCVSLRWGIEQGADRCAKRGHSIGWEVKHKRVCDDHERSDAEDPRNVL